MTGATREALSEMDRAVTKEDVLKLIPQFELRSILRRHHLNRTLIIGLVGQRGDGKSGTGAGIALIDFMLEGWPCYSNMDIRCDIEIDDETAHKYGLNSGGVAHYESIPLDKEAFLRFDPIYRRCIIFGDEMNMEMADARRSMSNTNLYSANVAQEIRHLESHLIYSVIDEMFVDNRLRSLTDVFLRCEDTALSVDGLSRKQPEGMNMKLIPYAMTGYLAGRENTYKRTQKPLTPVYFHFGSIRGIYDDKQLQATGKSKYGVVFKKVDDKGEMEAAIEADTGPTDNLYREYGWLADKVIEMKKSGIEYLSKYDLSQRLGVLLDRRTRDILGYFGVYFDRFKQKYKIESFELGGVTETVGAPEPI